MEQNLRNARRARDWAEPDGAAVRRDIHSAGIPILCRACEARHGGICGALTPAQLVRLGRQTRRWRAEAGAALAVPGHPPERCANILSGIVKLTKLMPDGRQQIVGLQFAPDFVGRPYRELSEVSAEAAGPVRLCTFPRAALEEMVRESPALAQRLHKQALRELDQARDWIMTLGRKSAAERVASFLLYVARNLAPEQEKPVVAFEIPLTRSEIADFLGLTVETVSRQLTRLRQAGVVGIERNRQVTILDLAALEASSGT